MLCDVVLCCVVVCGVAFGCVVVWFSLVVHGDVMCCLVVISCVGLRCYFFVLFGYVHF